jgi:hypothetical protein
VQEDSKILEDLLSFIYPDRQRIVFEELDPCFDVLKAAAKYQMEGIINTLTDQITSPQCKNNVTYQPLVYKDPVRVFAVAKHLAIERLSLIGREATLTIDIRNIIRSTEASNMLVSWLWELEDTRQERKQWLKDRCGTSFHVGNLDSFYHYQARPILFRPSACQCSGNSKDDKKFIPANVLERIENFPCPKTIRNIDFHLECTCLRCGAAATAFFKRVCEDYEAKFGGF